MYFEPTTMRLLAQIHYQELLDKAEADRKARRVREAAKHQSTPVARTSPWWMSVPWVVLLLSRTW